ncbi:hypothetical protein AMECASPLE_023672 [Ameca splendens]|uniref:Uncharacterized protein n=1 Tax=Ameca splendens TaxID=208324 RepID=A0ABV0YSA6_9TELE
MPLDAADFLCAELHRRREDDIITALHVISHLEQWVVLLLFVNFSGPMLHGSEGAFGCPLLWSPLCPPWVLGGRLK